MGLDIYFRKVKRARARKENESEEKYVNYLYKKYKEQDKKSVKALRNKIEKWIDKSDKYCNPMDLRRKVRNDFEYDYEIEPLCKATDLDGVKEWYNNISWEYFMMPDAAYFRKVNCLFRYFEDKLIDQCYCVVCKDDISDIVSRAKTVLKDRNKETSMRLLPTRDGFFFGSTDYDEWYYNQIEVVERKLSKVLKEWKDSDTMFVIMSW